jgi:hypothetical protein
MQVDTVHTAGSGELNEHARLLPTLLGAIIGAAIGVGLHLLLETGVAGTRPYEAIWFAIVIGVLTGLGVRMANKGHMGRSYARGGVSGFVALGAIVLSTYLISQVMARRDALNRNKPVAAAAAPAAADQPQTAAGANGPGAATPLPQENDTAQARGGTGVIGRPGADKLNPWQFLFMAAGALIAYELGRGVEHRRTASPVEAEPAGPATMTDPSN